MKTKYLRNKLHELIVYLDKEEGINYFKYKKEKQRFIAKIFIPEPNVVERKLDETTKLWLNLYIETFNVQENILNKYIEDVYDYFEGFECEYLNNYSFYTFQKKELKKIRENLNIFFNKIKKEELKPKNEWELREELNKCFGITSVIYDDNLWTSFFSNKKYEIECSDDLDIMKREIMFGKEERSQKRTKNYKKLKNMCIYEEIVFEALNNYYLNKLSKEDIDKLKKHKKAIEILDLLEVDCFIKKGLKVLKEKEKKDFSLGYLLQMKKTEKDKIIKKSFMKQTYIKYILEYCLKRYEKEEGNELEIIINSFPHWANIEKFEVGNFSLKELMKILKYNDKRFFEELNYNKKEPKKLMVTKEKGIFKNGYYDYFIREKLEEQNVKNKNCVLFNNKLKIKMLSDWIKISSKDMDFKSEIECGLIELSFRDYIYILEGIKKGEYIQIKVYDKDLNKYIECYQPEYKEEIIVKGYKVYEKSEYGELEEIGEVILK